MDDLLDMARRTAVDLLRTPEADDPGTPGCFLGGVPRVPRDFEWPIFLSGDWDVEVPMHFHSQVSLEALPEDHTIPPLPETGRLLVFIEPVLAMMERRRGEPMAMATGEAARVIWLPDETDEDVEAVMPPFPNLSGGDYMGVAPWYKSMLKETGKITPGYRRWSVDLVEVDTYPLPGAFNAEPGNVLLPDDCLDALAEVEADLWEVYSAVNPDFDYRARQASGAGHANRMFGASLSSKIPTAEAARQFGIRHAPLLSEDHALLMTLDDMRDIGLRLPGSFPVEIWINTETSARGVFDDIRLWGVSF